MQIVHVVKEGTIDLTESCKPTRYLTLLVIHRYIVNGKVHIHIFMLLIRYL